MLDKFPPEVTAVLVTIGIPILVWLVKFLLESVFSMFSKAIAQSFKGITDRLDSLESLVRDLLEKQTESSTRSDTVAHAHSEEIRSLRDRVHNCENAITKMATRCELCKK
jgi:hypothetical protein